MNVKKSISYFVTCTERMLDLAKNAEWEELIVIETQRRPDLEAFINFIDQESLQKNSLELRRAIEKILDLDNQISVLANETRCKAAEAILKNISTRKAMSEYQNNIVL